MTTLKAKLISNTNLLVYLLIMIYIISFLIPSKNNVIKLEFDSYVIHIGKRIESISLTQNDVSLNTKAYNVNYKSIISANSIIKQKLTPPSNSIKYVEPFRKVNFTQHTDLSLYHKNLTVNDMNEILERWYYINGTTFRGQGHIFIKAAKESGLHPVYILAHAAWESNWGKSSLARNKNNYFGIGAFDRDPYGHAYSFSEGMEQGIVQGSKWIKSNYYNQGQTTLYSMIYGNKCYASAQDKWINGISSIVRASFNYI